MKIVRDIFVFSCYTGLSYIDVVELSPEKTSLGIDKNYWIVLHREKPDQPARIPLLAKAIIEKYKSHPKVLAGNKILPVLSNRKLNSYLKEFADLCGIENNLTYHLAGNTLAATVTLCDVPVGSINKVSGHTSSKTTQIYAKAAEKKRSEDILKLKDKLDSKITINKRRITNN